MMEVEMLTTETETCKAPVTSPPPPTYNHSAFYRPDALPIIQPTATNY